MERASGAGRAGVDTWEAALARRESGWVGVIGPDLRPLGSRLLDAGELAHLTLLRRLDWPMSKRAQGLPYISVPFLQTPPLGNW